MPVCFAQKIGAQLLSFGPIQLKPLSRLAGVELEKVFLSSLSPPRCPTSVEPASQISAKVKESMLVLVQHGLASMTFEIQAGSTSSHSRNKRKRKVPPFVWRFTRAAQYVFVSA